MVSEAAFSSRRVQQALAGELRIDDLNDQEARDFLAGLAESWLDPGEAVRAFYANLGDGTDAPGVDESSLFCAPPEPPSGRMAGPSSIGTVISMAVDVWKDPRRAVTWLRLPHPLLDGQPPLLASATEYGAQQVIGILERFRNGTAS